MQSRRPGSAPPAAEPVTAAEFAGAIARLGPWDAARRVAVAVSGGPDSLALALLAQHWGDPVALIVDHGVRAGSAAEAETARAQLCARGLVARVLRLTKLRAGPGLPARARTARYAALSEACRAAGLVDLLVGHHAGDQAETVLMRRRSGSGAAGLAGMAALVETDWVRIVRPLLAFPPSRLRAVVDAAGIVPAEDPTNADLRTTRARLRREIGEDCAALLAGAAACGTARTASETRLAAEMAERVSLHPEGYAILSPGPVGVATLAAVLRSVAGRRLPVNGPAALADAPAVATLAGVRLMPAGRLGPGWLLVREHAAAPVVALRGVVWDGRFRVDCAPDGGEIGALGVDSAGFRAAAALPGAVLRTLPTFRRNRGCMVVPHLHPERCEVIVRNAVLPASGAPFVS